MQAVTTVAQHRQTWINELRDEIAHAVSCLTALMATKRSNLSYDDRLPILRDFDFHTTKIQLLINPNETDHRELGALLAKSATALGGYMLSDEDNNDELANISRRIIEISQPILKREWVRVKDRKLR